MRIESARLCRVVADVDGRLLADAPALDWPLELRSCVVLGVGGALVRGCASVSEWQALARTAHKLASVAAAANDAFSVYKVMTYPTRLETRIAEFSVCASH